MTELALFRVRVRCFVDLIDVNIAAPDYRSAEAKAIRHCAVLQRDTDISHFKVVSIEQNGSVVV